MKRLLVLLAALFVDCTFAQDVCHPGGSDVAIVHASTDFDTPEQSHLQHAAYRWNVFAKRVVISVERDSAERTCTISRHALPPPRIGQFQHEDGDIVITPYYTCGGAANDMACFEAIAMHEMGHLLGLNHLPVGQVGIMRAESGSLDFTDDDRVMCVANGICLDGAVK